MHISQSGLPFRSIDEEDDVVENSTRAGHVFFTQQFAAQLVRMLSDLRAIKETEVSRPALPQPSENDLFASRIYKAVLHTDTFEAVVSPSTLEHVLFVLKYSTLSQFSQLIELTAVESPGKPNPLKIVQVFLSLRYNVRLTVTTKINSFGQLPSIIYIYSSAN